MFWTNSSFTPADEDIEEEELFDEEAQLMASMGLPLAFASSSDHRRAVSPEIFKKLKINNCMLSQYLFIILSCKQPRQVKTVCPTHYLSADEVEEENEDDVQSDNEGNTG